MWAADVHICRSCKSGFADSRPIGYIATGSGCRLVAVPAFKAVRGAIMLSPVGSIPTPSAFVLRLYNRTNVG